MPKFYCEYCGQEFNNVRSLTASSCPRHPDDPGRGKHKLYEGSEKAKYTCRYCGQQFTSIRVMTAAACHRHPDGPGRGKHSPAL